MDGRSAAGSPKPSHLLHPLAAYGSQAADSRVLSFSADESFALMRVQYRAYTRTCSCSLHVPFKTPEPDTLYDHGHRETNDLGRS